MIFNEFRKIFAPRMIALLLIVGTVLYFSWTVGQMNLSHLPLFETVELKYGTELVEKYGPTLDQDEMEEIRILADKAETDLNTKLFLRFPELKALGVATYEAFEEYKSLEANWENEELEQLNQRIWEELSWELEVWDYYDQLVIHYDIYTLEHDTTEITTLPQSVYSNTGFIMEDNFRILMYLVWLLVLPYLAWDNLSKVGPLIATSRCGRKLLLKQMLAMVLAVLVVIVISNGVFYGGMRICTAYEPFFDCPVEEVAGNLTFHEYIIIKNLLVDGALVGLTLVFFVVSSFCKTIVGTVAAALPCWGLGELLTVFVFNHFLEAKLPGRGASAYNDFMAGIDNFPLWLDGTFLAIGIVLVGILYYWHATKDILD